MAHVAIAALVTVHILLYKRNVAASVSWIGIAWLSPFLGALLYVTMGINRVKRRAQRLRRQRLPMAIAEETLADAAAKDPLTPLEFAIGRLTGLPSEPGNRIEVLHSGDQAYPRMLAAIDGGGEERRPVDLHLPRRQGGRGLPPGADPGAAPRRRGAGADRRRRRRLFLFRHLQPSQPRRRPRRALPAFVFPLAHAVREPAQPSQGDGGRRPHRLHRRAQYRRREHQRRQAALRRPRHALPARGPDRRAAHRRLRRRLAVHDRREAAHRELVSAARERGPGVGACRHLRSRRGHGADRVRGAPRHLVRAKVGARGHALFPAARPADHGAGTGGSARHQGRHRPARPFQPSPCSTGRGASRFGR